MRFHFRPLLLLAFSAASSLLAQQPSFRLFTTQDGLVRNWVTKIHRDSRGYLWICTVEGISLFDGYRFTNFSLRDGLPSRLVADMIETRTGDYWFATEAGLARFQRSHRKTPAFEPIHVGDTKESNDVQAIYEGLDGSIWCGTAAGLYRFRPQDGDTTPHLILLGGASRLGVQALAEDPRRDLWLATEQGLLRRMPDGRTESVNTFIPPRLDCLLIDGHGRLWAGGYGLAGIDTNSEPPRLLAARDIPDNTHEHITALYGGDGGEIWVGKATRLVRFRPNGPTPEVQIYKGSDATPIDHVRSIAQDIRHNLWLGAGTQGLVRIAAGSLDRFTKAEGLESDEVHGLVESTGGTFYAVTGEWTLNEFRGGRFTPFPLRVPRPGFTWAFSPMVVQDVEGAWWAASGDGVLRYAAAKSPRDLRGRMPERIYSVSDGLPSPTILRLFLDSRGDMWAGTNDGVGHWNRSTGRWRGFRTADLLPKEATPAAVHSLAEDHCGNVWVGMYPRGLVRFHGNANDLITRDLPRGAINALLVDRSGDLWIGSSQGGVGRVEHPEAGEPRIRRYGLEQGLSSEHVFSLAEDDAGRIYVAGGRGVDRLDRETGTLRHFTSSSGVPPGETQSLFHDREGSIWFASLYGLSRYRPHPDQTSEIPAPLLRGVRLGGESYPISETGEREVHGIVLTPGHTGLEVEFRALHFDVGEVLRYQYRLENADRDWSAPSEEQTVRYANLEPGKYRFAVRSITESGQASAGHATLAFEVLPPFWKRSWFLGIAMLAVASGAVSLHRYRLNHVLALERVRTRLATDLHDDVGAGLAEIAILSEVAMRQERAGTLLLLDKIAGRARSLREAASDIVWAVDPREDSLSDLVLRLRQIAFTLLETEERRVEFLAPSEERLAIELVPDQRRHVLLFFKEAVTNVARHAKATAVRVEILLDGGCFRMLIRDNGRGFDPLLPRSGRGLESLQYRARELHGGCRIESAPSHGTKVELSLPL
jgi:ligand-binding sensor domain-containing protein/signal transduction histidine kinase